MGPCLGSCYLAQLAWNTWQSSECRITTCIIMVALCIYCILLHNIFPSTYKYYLLKLVRRYLNSI